jgi:tetratricopeptide (TPR) repeat protein
VFDRLQLTLVLLFLLIANGPFLCCFAINAEDQREYLALIAIADLNVRLKRLDRYLLSHPTAARLFGYRAEIHNALEHTEETIADANKYFQLNKEPVLAQICKVRAQSYLKKGDNEKALADLVWAKKLAPKDGEGALMLGMVLERMGRNEEALVEYGRSIELKFSRAYSSRADLKLRLSMLNEGLADGLKYMRITKDLNWQDSILSEFTRMKMFPEQVFLCDGFIKAGLAKPIVYSTKANALFKLKRYDEALKACDQSGSSCGDQLDMQRLDIWVAKKQSEQVMAQLRKLIKAKPEDLRLYLFRADCFMQNRHYDLALADLIHANFLVLKDKAALAKKAECYFRLGKYMEAVREYGVINHSNSNSGNVETHTFEALSLKALSKYKEAAESFTRALKLKPLSSTLLNYRAECYFKLHDYKKAEADMTDAIALSPKKYSYYCVRGTFRQGSGATASAIEDYTAALVDPRMHSMAYGLRAKAYRKLGQVSLAEKDERAAAASSKALEVDLFK